VRNMTAPSGAACRASAAPATVLLADIRVDAIHIGDRVWLGGELQRVQDTSPGTLPGYTTLAVDTGQAFMFPDAAFLQVQYSPVVWPEHSPA
jgi:hypothetical protein